MYMRIKELMQNCWLERVFLALAVISLTACSDDDPVAGISDDEIHFQADVWQVMEGTRATTYDDIAAMQASTEKFACYAFVDGSTNLYIDGSVSTVSWNSIESKWLFDDGKHYWPASGALNFFAHLPATLPSYCTFDPTAYDAGANDDGYSEDCPRLTCTALPVDLDTDDDTKEVVYAYVAQQDKNGTNTSLQPTAGQVALTFKHPFARVKFKLSEASGSNVVVNSVTIAGVKNNGIATFNGTTTTWTPSGDATNLVVTGTPATSDTPYLVLPQSFDTSLTFTVNATWNDWSTVTKDVSASVAVGSWQPGYSYTYTFTLSKYALKVDTEKFTEQW